MGEVHSEHSDPLTTAIARRLEDLWDAYGRGDVESHNAILAPDYESVHPDGSIHRPPTAGEIAAAPMASYRLDDLRVWPVAPGVALARYVAEVSGERDGQRLTLRWVVAELWLERDGTWRCRHYQPTML